MTQFFRSLCCCWRRRMTWLSALMSTRSSFSGIQFEVMEGFEWKQPYTDLKVEVEAPGPEDVEREVEELLMDARKQSGTLAVAADRPLEAGDVAIVDVALRRIVDGQDPSRSQPEQEQKRIRLDMSRADKELSLPGLTQGLEGMRVGETRTLDLTAQGAWWDSTTGEPGTAYAVEVTLHELFVWSLPEVTEEWAKAVFPEGDGLGSLMAHFREIAEEEVESIRENALEDAVLLALADIVDIDLPDCYFRDLAQSFYAKELLTAQASGKMTPQQVGALATPRMLDSFIDHKRDFIAAMGRATLGIDDIYEEEELTVDKERIKAQVEESVRERRQAGAKIDEQGLLKSVEDAARTREVIRVADGEL
eukprot:jgi/Botrbrau1/1872/Bobra.146_1s0059.1